MPFAGFEDLSVAFESRGCSIVKHGACLEGDEQCLSFKLLNLENVSAEVKDHLLMLATRFLVAHANAHSPGMRYDVRYTSPHGDNKHTKIAWYANSKLGRGRGGTGIGYDQSIGCYISYESS